jgi:hypothetical protein
MTSEAAVMNRLAVALAADSAVSVSDGRRSKVYNTANKLFMLSNRDPVGVMVYQNGSLMGVPWEVLIKTFRTTLPDEGFPTLEEYAAAFLVYIEGQKELFTSELQERYFREMVESEFAELARQVQKALREEEEKIKDDDDWEAIRDATIKRKIREAHQEWSEYETYLGIPSDHGKNLRTQASGEVSKIILTHFRTRGWTIPSDDIQLLNELAEFYVEKNFIAPASFTGLVVAGFGKSEFFPVLKRFRVGNVYDGHLKRVELDAVKITEEEPVHVGVYADSDMAELFLKGFSPPALNMFLREAFKRGHQIAAETLNIMKVSPDDRACDAIEQKCDELLMELVDTIQRYRHRSGMTDFEKALIHIPKDELANVAASLVNLNSFKKRMSMNIESVGGPVDVAVISKGDGLIWIDRKHYFEAEKNPQYMQRQLRQSGTEAPQ